MKNSRAFTPTVTDTLEDRSVPSGFGGHASHVFTINTFASTRAVTVPTPVHVPPGTFFQGSNPAIVTAANGERLTLNSGRFRSAPSLTKAAVVVTPHAVVPTPVHVPPGTFFQGSNPGVVTATNGERLTLNRF